MSLAWYARNSQDALDGMLMLTLEERGAYNTVLDLIYSRSGPVPDDERWLSGWMGCSVKKWRLIRAVLLVKGKLQQAEMADGQPALMNERARQEIISASARRRVAAESGASGGRKTAQKKTKSNENKADPQASLPGSLKLYTDTKTKTEEAPPSPDGDGPPHDKAKGSRLPECWFPTPTVAGDELILPPDLWAIELDKFRDYWRAVPGAKGRKLDWDATWRNWMRRASQDISTRKPHGQRPSDNRRDAYLERLSDIDAAMAVAFVEPRREH